jgi:hypothetical protein
MNGGEGVNPATDLAKDLAELAEFRRAAAAKTVVKL